MSCSLELQGISVLPADSWWGGGVSATRKILQRFSNTQVPVAEVTLKGINPFPDQWRKEVFKIDFMPALNQTPLEDEVSPQAPVTGQALLAASLVSAKEPVTIIATGPLTNIAWVLDNHPELESRIAEVLITGGALNVPGNVFPKDAEGSDGSPEWNFFWDPPAAKRVWDSKLRLVLTPLDSTNEVPVSKDILLRYYVKVGG
ncbi:unnamed protein product [Choristocarpus tenellus]